MKTVTINPAVPAPLALGRIGPARVDATTEKDIIAAHQAADEAEAMQGHGEVRTPGQKTSWTEPGRVFTAD